MIIQLFVNTMELPIFTVYYRRLVNEPDSTTTHSRVAAAPRIAANTVYSSNICEAQPKPSLNNPG